MRIPVTVLGFFLFINLLAQDNKKYEFQFDLGSTLTIPYNRKAELWSWYEGHPVDTYKTGAGYFAELLVTSITPGQLQFGTGINLEYSELNANHTLTYTEWKGKIDMFYMKIPFFVSYQVSKKIPISISAGPYWGFRLNTRESGTSYIDTTKLDLGDGGDLVIEDLDLESDYDTDTSDSFKSLNFGLSLQVEYRLNASGNHKVLFLSRFDYGLTNVLEKITDYSLATEKWKNYILMFGIGITL
jgi:hypothetical protein